MMEHENTNEKGVEDASKYVLIAFTISWLAWILAIKLHLREGLLYVGSAGPAFAAMILSRKRTDRSSRTSLRRAVLFAAALGPCWIVMCFYFSWRGGFATPVKIDPWLLLPAFCPAWILSGVSSSDSGVRLLVRRLVHAPSRWSLIGFFLFPSILVAGNLIGTAMHIPLVHPSRAGSQTSMVVWATSLFAFNLLFTATEEEPGWRGFLLDGLQRRFSPLVACFFVWLPWALWHGPLDYYRPERFSLLAYLELRVVFLIPLVILMTWIYNRSGRSIQSTALFHSSMNTFPFVMPYFPPGLALLFLLAGVVLVADRMWRKDSSATLEPKAIAANPTH